MDDDRFSSFCQRWSGWMHVDGSVGLQSHGADAAERVADGNAPRHLELALRHRSVAEQLGERARHDRVKGVHDRSVTFRAMRLILASASPRRAELLRAAGIPFEVSPVEVDERFHAGEKPEQAVARLAEAKATRRGGAPSRLRSCSAPTRPSSIRGEALGKPADAADAARMLRLLSGAHARGSDRRLSVRTGPDARPCRAHARADGAD